MKFEFKKASDPYGKKWPDIEINSLEELMELIKKEGELIISEGMIKVYDNWVE